jgi:hypothetical protein
MEIVDLEPGDPHLVGERLPVLHELRPHLTVASFGDVYREGHAQGLRYAAVYDGGRCVAVAGSRWGPEPAGTFAAPATQIAA